MISQLLNMHRVKFTVLDELFKGYEFNKKKPINIHIDLHSLLSDLYKAKNYTETNWIDKNEGVAISSCIINLAAHYRLYFYSRYRMNTRIFIYFCNSKPKNNSKYIATYGHHYFDKYSKDNEEYKPVNVEVSNNLKLVKIITSYLKNVFYIDCKNIEPLIASAYMGTTHDGINLVLTRDEFWYQSVNCATETMVLHLKRDKSFLVKKDNVINTLLKEKTYKSQYIESGLLSTIYSFTGINSRDIRGIKDYGIVKITKILDLAINRHLIKSSYTHIKNILDEIYDSENSEYLINIFKSIDLQYQLNELSMVQKEELKNNLIDRYNKRDLVHLNNTHYKGEYSLMLDELSKGDLSYDSGIKW